MARPVGIGVSANASTPLFLHNTELFLRSNDYLSSGEPFGLMPTSEYRRFGMDVDGRGMWKPGTDHVRNLDVPATLANHKPVARKFTGGDNPQNLYIVAENSNRYLGSTGIKYQTLQALTRLTVAMSALAMENGGGVITPVYVSGSEITDIEQVDSSEAMEAFDNLPLGDDSKMAESGLARALKAVNRDEPDLSSDAVVVVSDFITGTQYGANGNVEGFDWERPLNELHQAISTPNGDRFFVVRLSTPAHTEPPLARTFLDHNGTKELNAEDFAAFSDRYAAIGQAKARRIASVLHGIRHVNLSSVDPRPMTTTADFIYSQAA